MGLLDHLEAPLPLELDEAILGFLSSFEKRPLRGLKLFLKIYGPFLRRVSGQGWYFWDSQKWCNYEKGLVRSLVTCMSRHLERVASESSDRHVLDGHAKFENFHYQKELAHLIESEHSLIITPSDLDSHEYLVNVANGVLDLSGPAPVLRPHHPKYLLTKMCPVPYIPDTKADRWEQFMLEVANGHPELVPYIQRVLGYALTGSIREQCFFFLYGVGANGKSTFLDTIKKVLGDYVTKAPVETFLRRGPDRHSQDLAALSGSRIVCSSETPGTKSFDESILKVLTGDEEFSARRLFQNQQTFPITFKLFFAGNHPPKFTHVDAALERRLQTIPFESVFGRDRLDPDLPKKLQAEFPGILAWIVRGFVEWRAHGLCPPPVVVSASKNCLASQNTVATFVEEHCEFQPECEVPLKDLHDLYKSVCDEMDRPAKSSKELAEYFRGRGLETRRRSTGLMVIGVKKKGVDD